MSIVEFDKGKLLYDSYLRLRSAGKLDEAKEALNQAIKLSEPMAIHAWAYELYQKGGLDVARAIILYKRAARMGLEASAWNLVRHYDVTHQPRSYFYWLNQSKKLGESDAIIELLSPFPFTVAAALELESRGLIREAIKLYQFASRYGNSDADAAVKRLQPISKLK